MPLVENLIIQNDQNSPKTTQSKIRQTKNQINYGTYCQCDICYQLTYFPFSGILSVTIPQPSYNVNYGQNVQLVCTVSGNPAATSVYWEKVRNGIATTINSNTNTNKYTGSTVNTPSLTILNAKADDQAVYTCFAENAIGKGQSQQTQLQIIGSKHFLD